MFRTVLLVCWVALAGVPAMAQEPETLDVGSERWRKIAGGELSDYDVVSNFFVGAHAWMVRLEDPRIFAEFLKELRIDLEDPALEILTDAVLKAHDIMSATTIDPSLSGAAWEAHQIRALRLRTIRLGLLYADFRRDLDRVGYPLEHLDTYLEERVRPDVAVFTTDDPIDLRAFEVMRDFSRVVDNPGLFREEINP